MLLIREEKSMQVRTKYACRVMIAHSVCSLIVALVAEVAGVVGETGVGGVGVWDLYIAWPVS